MPFLPTIIGTFNGIGPLGNTAGFSPSQQFTNIISNIVGVLTVTAGIWFVFQMIIGAINWVSAGSDKQSLDNARKRLTNAIIGLTIVISAYTLIGIIGLFLGFDILGLQALIVSLRP